jgi:hypothetical protein
MVSSNRVRTPLMRSRESGLSSIMKFCDCIFGPGQQYEEGKRSIQFHMILTTAKSGSKMRFVCSTACILTLAFKLLLGVSHQELAFS